ncbi:MAG: cell division protein FtsZ [Rickettsiales bacterium]|nr:cell division protein FtsZ [Rickettsiales bacterium]
MSSLKLDIENVDNLKPRIIIFGVGGAGGNAINNMIKSNLEGVEFVAANTDSQSLENSSAKHKIQLGLKVTKGLGAGSFPDKGRASAEENVEDIVKYLEGCNMVFIAAGMGGGTGTGAAPVIAKLARERDILTVGVVTKPFHFEGKYRMQTAEAGIEELKKYVDTLIVIPNQNLFRIANENTTFESAFKMADDVLHAGVRGVTDLITMPGLVNLDFADIRTIMTKMGKAMMGTGEAEGENRAVAACEAAISNPLLDDISISGAKGVLVNMTGGPDMTLFEADMAVNAIKKEVDSNANIIFGSAFNEDMKGKIRISVVATGIDSEEFHRADDNESTLYEPKRFNLNDEDSDSLVVSRNEGFFDPGKSVLVEEDDLQESNMVDLNLSTSKQNDRKEERVEKKERKSIFSRSKKVKDLSREEKIEESTIEEEKIDYFDAAEDKKSESVVDIADSSVDKKQDIVHSIEKDRKQDASGFSLFSFMNTKTEDGFENDNNVATENRDELYVRKQSRQSEEKAKKIVLENESKKHAIPEKNANIEEKRNKFFNSTIFDDDQDDSGVEDDILNVPAFFRRKKK